MGPCAIVTLPSHGSGGRMGPCAIVTLPSHGSGGRMGPVRDRHVAVPRIGREDGTRARSSRSRPTDRAGGWDRARSSRSRPMDRAAMMGPCAIVTFPSHGSGGMMGPAANVTFPSHGSGGDDGPGGDRHVPVPWIGRDDGTVRQSSRSRPMDRAAGWDRAQHSPAPPALDDCEPAHRCPEGRSTHKQARTRQEPRRTSTCFRVIDSLRSSFY